MVFKKRDTILGLPIGRKKTSWGKVGALVAGLLAAAAAVVIGRDTLQHGAGRQGGESGQDGESQ